MADLMAGRVDATFNATGSLLHPLKSGAQTRYHVKPTIQDSARAADNGGNWLRLRSDLMVRNIVPAKTLAPIMREMHDGIVIAVGDTDVKRRFEPLGVAVAA